MTTHKVLWIDDDPDEEFIERCGRRGIALVTKKIRNEGITELKANLDSYSGVILDVKMPETNETEVAGMDGFADVKQIVENRIPYYIFTGQPDLASEDWFCKTYKKFYQKGASGDGVLGSDDLLEDMLNDFNKSPERQIEDMYDSVFSSLEKFGANYRKVGVDILVPILKNLHFPSDDFNPALHYNQLRIMVEYIFRILNDRNILPDEFIENGDVNINQSYYYLTGGEPNHIKFRYGEKGDRVFPKHFENILLPIITLGNTSSHSAKLTDKDEDKIKVFFDRNDARCLVMSFALQLCEVIRWMYKNIDSIPDKKRTSALQRAKEKYEGDERIFKWNDEGFWYIDRLKISTDQAPLLRGTIDKVYVNNGADSESFPFYATLKNNK